MSSSDSSSDDETVPSHADHKAAGNEAYRRKDYRAAIAHYTLAIESASSELEASESESAEGSSSPPPQAGNDTKELRQSLASYFTNRAAGFSMLLQYAEAIRDCDAALEADPSSSWGKAHVRKAKAYTALGRIDDAIKSYSLGMVRDPNNASLVKEKEELVKMKRRYELAEGLMAKQRGDGKEVESEAARKRDARQALAQIELVLAACPNWNAATLLKIEALVHLNRCMEAYPTTTSLMRRTGGDGGGAAPLTERESHRLLLLRAKCLFDTGNLDDASKHLRQIITSNPDDKIASSFLKTLRTLGKKKAEGDTHYKSRRFEEAVKSYTEALELCPPDAGSYRAKLFFNRASANANLRNHEQVVKDCTSATRLDDGYSKAYLRRAASNLVIGGKAECEAAIRDYERALELAGGEEAARDIKRKLQGARVQLKRASRKDFYKVLGVKRDANEAEIKKSYRKLALKWHPDRHSNSTDVEKKKADDMFREVNFAYEVLSDPAKKRRYDDGVDEQDLDNPHATAGGGPGGMGMHHGHGGMGGIDPNLIFQMFMQQQGGGGFGGGGGGFRFG